MTTPIRIFNVAWLAAPLLCVSVDVLAQPVTESVVLLNSGKMERIAPLIVPAWVTTYSYGPGYGLDCNQTKSVVSGPLESSFPTDVPLGIKASPYGLTVRRVNGIWQPVPLEEETTETHTDISSTVHKRSFSLAADGTLSSRLEEIYQITWTSATGYGHTEYDTINTLTLNLNSGIGTGGVTHTRQDTQHDTVLVGGCAWRDMASSTPYSGSFGPVRIDFQLDSDGDGLPDEWEKNGYTAYVGGQPVFVDLPKMGANPRRKDLFVEIDWMDGAHGSHRPKPEAVSRVVTAFANSPVSNVDGSSGITLHVDYGQSPASGGNAVQEVQFLDWPTFYQIKSTNFSPARSRAFRYVVFGHSYGECQNDLLRCFSGYTHNDESSANAFMQGSSDAMVTLGTFAGSVGTVNEQAGTLMHELGHTLGLAHGGTDFDTYKPNYLSVMNYSFQTSGLCDYSPYALGSLDEANGLNENIGIGSSQRTVFWCLNHLAGVNYGEYALHGQPVDWNCDGSYQTNVKSDVNGDGHKTLLKGSGDWGNLIFWTGSVGQIATAALQEERNSERFTKRADVDDQPWQGELTAAMDTMVPKPIGVSLEVLDGLRGIAVGQSVVMRLRARNLGTASDTFALTTTTPANLTVTGPVSVAVPAGGQVDFSVNVACTSASANAPTIVMRATSSADTSVVDEGVLRFVVSLVATPEHLVATASSSTSIALSWAAVAGATSYDIVRMPGGAVSMSSVSTGFVDSTASPNGVFVYRVRAVDSSNHLSAFSDADIATTVYVGVSPILGGIDAIRASDLLTLRAAVNLLRTAVGLPPSTFTDSNLVGKLVKATHVLEIREALNGARSVIGLAQLFFHDASLAVGHTIKAADVNELSESLR